MHAVALFTEKYLQSYDCSGTNLMATANCTNPETEIQIEIIGKQIIGVKIYFVIKKYFPFKWQTCFFAVT